MSSLRVTQDTSIDNILSLSILNYIPQYFQILKVHKKFFCPGKINLSNLLFTPQTRCESVYNALSRFIDRCTFSKIACQ